MNRKINFQILERLCVLCGDMETRISTLDSEEIIRLVKMRKAARDIEIAMYETPVTVFVR